MRNQYTLIPLVAVVFSCTDPPAVDCEDNTQCAIGERCQDGECVTLQGKGEGEGDAGGEGEEGEGEGEVAGEGEGEGEGVGEGEGDDGRITLVAQQVGALAQSSASQRGAVTGVITVVSPIRMSGTSFTLQSH